MRCDRGVCPCTATVCLSGLDTIYDIGLSTSPVQLPLVGPECVPHFANVLNGVLRSTTTALYWVHIPMVAPNLSGAEDVAENAPDASTENDPWEWWAALRQLCTPVLFGFVSF